MAGGPCVCVDDVQGSQGFLRMGGALTVFYQRAFNGLLCFAFHALLTT